MKGSKGICFVAMYLWLGGAQPLRAEEASATSDADRGGGIDVSFSGFVRVESALKTQDKENMFNQGGNSFNGVAVARAAYVPPAFGPPNWNSVPFGITDTMSRPIESTDNTSNLQIVRGEGQLNVKFTDDLKLFVRMRAIGDIGNYDDFDARSVRNMYGGISGGLSSLYAGPVNYFQYRVDGDNHPNPLEWSGRDYMVDLPALFLDYNHGPFNARLGNQTIAWGQAIFFRVLDVPNGLDLRRHSVLDYAQEEFADKRVPALALRLSDQISDAVLLDGYVQKFQPKIYGNPNTQYNVIPSQFTVHDLYTQGGYDDKLSAGLRIKANYGQWGFQGIVARRYNPDGVFRWAASGVNKPLPNTNFDGTPNALAVAVNGANAGNAGTALQNTPFEASPGGVYTAREWFATAAAARLDGIGALNAAVAMFPSTANVFASSVANYQEASNELNTFFMAAGGSLRGHIAREYFQETNIGAGISYVSEGEPGSFLDQLIVNLEATYTPHRIFTAPDLNGGFLRDNDLVSALVVEKYQRFSQAFPATYLVFQYMHRTSSDLFGRSLQGYGGTVNTTPRGIKSADYAVIAIQQPLPQEIFKFGFATLYDPRGSILVQPGVQWKPSGRWAVDFFYSYINGHLRGNSNDSVLGNLEFGNELTLRVGAQF
jgi:hypothetical protein